MSTSVQRCVGAGSFDRSIVRLFVLTACLIVGGQAIAFGDTATARPRVVVSTDIGGTDPDDLQSMVHLLAYADAFDLEGLISSPFGPGRKDHILQVINHYERDYANLRKHSDRYPTPDTLRSMTMQGAIEGMGFEGFGSPTEGSEWIVRCARRDDPRPLWLLVWSGIDDLAQALHDAPAILPKLRVYFIGGPNKKWSFNAYYYVATLHPRLWIIEANATYRGWFVGGDQVGEWSNQGFVATHVSDCGALGGFFATLLDGTMKMGDTPSVVYLLRDRPEDPSTPGWGGRFVRAWKRPYAVFERLTTPADRIEQFGILELVLPLGEVAHPRPEVVMQIENQSLKGFVDAGGTIRFRFSPKAAREYRYTLRGNVPGLNGRVGQITAFRTPPDSAQRPDPSVPNWWTDDPAPEAAEGQHIGARTVSRWRREYLSDFAGRMLRCKTPAPYGVNRAGGERIPLMNVASAPTEPTASPAQSQRGRANAR